MTPHLFAQKWKVSQLKERSASQEHFLETLPFPEGLTPANEVSPPPLQGEGRGGDGVNNVTKTHPHPNLPPEGEGVATRISADAKPLDQLRNNWLNPPKWVGWVCPPRRCRTRKSCAACWR